MSLARGVRNEPWATSGDRSCSRGRSTEKPPRRRRRNAKPPKVKEHKPPSPETVSVPGFFISVGGVLEVGGKFVNGSVKPREYVGIGVDLIGTLMLYC